MVGEEGFYSPMIGSQSFSEPMLLDFELHTCLSVFFSTLGGTGWLEWALVRYFPCPGQLDSKIILADYSGLLIHFESRFC